VPPPSAEHEANAPIQEAAPPSPPDQAHAGNPRGALARCVALWPRIDPVLFAAYAGACILYAASAFYGSLHRQTGGVWSAPLDDVFIHFDYARATARGYPFQWSEGNGFSSGNTSLSYPFVLALGYLVGFRGLLLMQWAALLACASTFAFLLAGARLLEPVGRWAKYLLPPVVLSIGALDWSLFSGMENAFHLGVWALALTATLSLVDAADRGEPDAGPRVARLGWLSGLAGALLFVTRPESIVCVAAFGVLAALAVRRSRVERALPSGRAALATLLRTSIPGAIAFVAQAVANRAFTGEWAANGAIAKLALNNPYMTAGEKWETYRSLADYVIYRNTDHHFADARPWGYIVPALAVVPLAFRATRTLALVVWVQIAGWLALVALNGQVRWQNERYTMAAVAWLLLLAATGLALLVSRLSPAAADGPSPSRELGRLRARLGAAAARVSALAYGARDTLGARIVWGTRVALGLSLAALFWAHQLPRMRDQIWFFGRASRNIRDQHLVAGRLLAQLGVRRVLVGDAGGLLYASDVPGLDLIGLGGYHDLPFARAGVHGLGASLELIERIPPPERPDTLAIYPTWWGDLPAIFGHRLIAVPVVGNVICGGAEKVIYHADWSPMENQPRPASMHPDERVADELDVADLVSEREHGYVFPHPGMGFVGFSVLPDPRQPSRDLFDAGRLIPGGMSETARLRAPRGPGRLVVRTASVRPAVVQVTADGRALGRLAIRESSGWAETSLDLPADLPETFTLALTPVEGEWSDHHVWILDRALSGEKRPLAGQ
jgi:hypothetical protein